MASQAAYTIFCLISEYFKYPANQSILLIVPKSKEFHKLNNKARDQRAIIWVLQEYPQTTFLVLQTQGGDSF
ncbi:MAG: hypothetical protein KDJ99_10790 [Candidatus Competibacteraceae bacterium]|nr:hypothetical protein [Candidatus Competibacteraceae bacterium]